jgi:hypothetical protein
MADNYSHNGKSLVQVRTVFDFQRSIGIHILASPFPTWAHSNPPHNLQSLSQSHPSKPSKSSPEEEGIACFTCQYRQWKRKRTIQLALAHAWLVLRGSVRRCRAWCLMRSRKVRRARSGLFLCFSGVSPYR